MQSLEGACEESERTIKRIKTSRSSLPLLHPQESVESAEPPHNHQTPPFCIYTKFLELYREECAKETTENKPGLKRTSQILEKLVARERLNTLILNLHSGNWGSSLALRTIPRNLNQNLDDTANMIETNKWPLEEHGLLKYISNEELPPYLTDMLEANYSFLFYNGCVIAEVRDYRQSFPLCNVHHVLLRPTCKSVWADINNLVEEKPDYGTEEKQHLESQILLANKPSLCLDPDNSVSTKQSQINHNRHMWNTHRFHRIARRDSQKAVNRKRRLDKFTHTPGLELYEFNCRTRAKDKVKKSLDEIKPVPVPNLEPPPLSAPSQGVFINDFFKAYERPEETSDCSPQLVEEYVLETDMPSKGTGEHRIYHIKLSILMRPSNSEYLGELYLDRDHKKNERNGVACRFSLGSRTNADRYIHQFTEIFTESGRKAARIIYGLSSAVDKSKQLSLQGTSCVLTATPLVNGAIPSTTRISLVPPRQSIQNTSHVPTLQSHLQGTTLMKPTSQISSQELEINALATKLMNSAQQFQAAANAKQKLQQTRNNPAIRNLLNSSPASNINNDAVVNAINNSSLLPQQVQTINQKLMARKMTFSNVANARVLNHSNIITVNNNRMSVSELNQQQQQTITLSNTNFATMKQISASEGSKSTLSALLVSTPAADRPDIVAPSSNSLLLESLKPGLQYMVQSPPKSNTVVSPLSSPPTQNTNTINFAQLQSLSGLQNVQVQLPGFAQPISLSLNMSSTANIQHPTSLLVTMPVSTGTNTSNTITQSVGNINAGGVTSLGVGTPVVLANAGSSNIAQLVTSGVKGIGQQGIRASGTSQVSLTQGGQPFQLLTPLQRPRLQQGAIQQNLTNRTIQRTPITIKMATPNSNSATLPTNASISSQLQKAQYQQYQQLCLNQQQKNVAAGGAGKLRRTNPSEPQ